MVKLAGASPIKEIEWMIKDMDKDKNWLLTFKELQEIFIQVYGDQKKSLLKIFNQYATV